MIFFLLVHHVLFLLNYPDYGYSHRRPFGKREYFEAPSPIYPVQLVLLHPKHEHHIFQLHIMQYFPSRTSAQNLHSRF